MVPHGIMFHHFSDARHPRGQGAISAAELDAMIQHLGPQRILPAKLWQERALAGELKPHDLCLTFDDNLRCQFDVALPVLRHHGLTAFWFVYTSVLLGSFERLELYRLFRTLHYPTVDRFYEDFFATINTGPYSQIVSARLASFSPASFLREFPFYSDSDRTFRFVRDEVLGEARYFETMDQMIADAGVKIDELARDLWMTDSDLVQLQKEDHVIGLHSHTHPTRLGELSHDEQLRQYSTNQTILAEILGEQPTAMSHPCNSYSPGTKAILESIGIQLGFRANMAQARYSMFEHPREDHANLVKRMAA